MATKAKKKASIVLDIEMKPDEMQSVELVLSRMGVVTAERRGVLDMQAAQKAPTAYFFALAYAAVLGTIRNVSQGQVDDALDRWFDAGGLFEDLSENLLNQYSILFGIAEVTGNE